ncbi:MAG: 2-oxo acid dehydrogenase subunit E2 [Lentisphaerota bacterium]
MEIKVPELGENIKEGDVVKVLVKEGDTLSKDQTILELETGKATLEVPSTHAGRVASLQVKAGDKVKIGQVILMLESADSVSAAPQQPPVQTATAASAPAEKSPAAPATQAPVPQAAPPAAPPAAKGVPVAAAPSVRTFAREIGVEISQVQGSGPNRRITIEDVKQLAKQLITSRPAATAPGMITPPPLPDFSKWGPVEREPMSSVRRKTAEHMALAWATIPHVTQHDLANITELETLRKRFAPKAEAAGGKLTMTAILLKIIAAALKVFPKFNASIDMAGQSVILKKYTHIGVAVDTPRGLLVPVIRDVEKKNIIQLSVELSQLAVKAREGKMSMEDLTGGTFTLTNLGGIGGSFFTPIINMPEVAILGVARARMDPTCGPKDNLCAPRLMLPLSLSYDHRLIDGADGARFLKWIVEAIEEPLMISLEG